MGSVSYGCDVRAWIYITFIGVIDSDVYTTLSDMFMALQQCKGTLT